MAERFGIDRVLTLSVLAQVNLVLPEMPVYRAAGLLRGDKLRTLDAVHVAQCLDLAADLMISYDDRQIAAARAAGIATRSPGRP